MKKAKELFEALHLLLVEGAHVIRARDHKSPGGYWAALMAVSYGANYGDLFMCSDLVPVNSNSDFGEVRFFHHIRSTGRNFFEIEYMSKGGGIITATGIGSKPRMLTKKTVGLSARVIHGKRN